MRLFILLTAVACSGAAQAIQPVEAGLLPLLARYQAVVGEQQALNVLLQSPETALSDRAFAYREYSKFEVERRQLDCEIARARRWATAPLVMHATPAGGSACQQNLASRFSESLSAPDELHP